MIFFGHSNFFKALAIGTLSLAAGLVYGDGSVRYRNPVMPGDHPDPTIIRVGQHDYWAAATTGDWGPEFPLLHSRDLVNWELEGAVFYHRPAWAERSFWAPELWECQGHFLVYYAARKHDGPLSVAVAMADRPEGPYVDQGPLVSQPDGSIDPAAVRDENGKPYLIWKEDGNSEGKPTPIWAQPLEESGTKLTGRPVELIRNDADWEGAVVEGPYILRRGGWFYLFYSGNGCCGPDCHYALGVARSHALLGPWEKNPVNPILFANDTWKCPGHGTIVTDPEGRYWLLYHAYPADGSTATGREAMLDEVVFGADGWPTINQAQGPSVEAPSPFGVAQRPVAVAFTDKFSGKELNAGWRWPLRREPAWELKRGRLALLANGHGGDPVGVFIARSVAAADYEATTVVAAGDMPAGSAAGLAALSEAGDGEGVAVADGQLLAWRRARGEAAEVTKEPAPAGKKIYLRVTVRQGSRRQFFASGDGRQWTEVGAKSSEAAGEPGRQSYRIALTVGGGASARGEFDGFTLKPLATDAKN